MKQIFTKIFGAREHFILDIKTPDNFMQISQTIQMFDWLFISLFLYIILLYYTDHCTLKNSSFRQSQYVANVHIEAVVQHF